MTMRLHAIEKVCKCRREQRDAFGMALALSNSLMSIWLREISTVPGSTRKRRCDCGQVRDAGGSAYSIYSLGEIARLRGDSAEATRYLTDSLARFEALGEKIGLAYTACSLGDLASQAGDTARAADLLSRSLRTRTEMGDKRGVIECLEAFAIAAIRSGADQLGFRLLGAAGAERVVLSCPVPPSTQHAYDRALAAGRARLGEAAVDALREEGGLLDPTQALLLAREILGAPRSEVSHHVGCHTRRRACQRGDHRIGRGTGGGHQVLSDDRRSGSSRRQRRIPGAGSRSDPAWSENSPSPSAGRCRRGAGATIFMPRSWPAGP